DGGRAEREDVGGSPAGHGQSLISQRMAPLATVAPTSAVSPVTVPALCAVHGCVIFIASSTNTTAPAATCWPSATASLTIVPCMGLVNASPLAAVPDLRVARRGARPGAPG